MTKRMIAWAIRAIGLGLLYFPGLPAFLNVVAGNYMWAALYLALSIILVWSVEMIAAAVER